MSDTVYLQQKIEVDIWIKVENPNAYFNIKDYDFEIKVKSLTHGLEVLEAKVEK